MPEQETIERAERDKEEGKAPSAQAGEFVREEMHHVREGKHGARSQQQAIAIGLSKARRAGVKLAPPKRFEERKQIERFKVRAFAADTRSYEKARPFVATQRSDESGAHERKRRNAAGWEEGRA